MLLNCLILIIFLLLYYKIELIFLNLDIINQMTCNKDTFYNQSCFDNENGASFFQLIDNSNDDTFPFFGPPDKYDEIDEEKQHNDWINSEIDSRYENGEFKDRGLHAALSGHKYYYAGQAVYEFFTDDSINQISIGNSSGDMRNHTIFKCRKRKMVFEVHNGHGNLDIFPLYGIMDYLKAYKPDIANREDFIKLSNSLPNYDMVPLSTD